MNMNGFIKRGFEKREALWNSGKEENEGIVKENSGAILKERQKEGMKGIDR